MYAVLALFFRPGAEQVAAALCIRIIFCNGTESKEDMAGSFLHMFVRQIMLMLMIFIEFMITMIVVMIMIKTAMSCEFFICQAFFKHNDEVINHILSIIRCASLGFIAG